MHNRAIYNSDHELFRASARRFFSEELEPYIDQWEKEGQLPKEFWLKAGENGFHCCGVPSEYGGPGADFLYNMVLQTCNTQIIIYRSNVYRLYVTN